jgi:hypothetical protein
LEKLKKPVTLRIAKIQANPVHTVATAYHHITAVPCQNPNCRINHTICKTLPYSYTDYMRNKYTGLNIRAGTALSLVPQPFYDLLATLFVQA